MLREIVLLRRLSALPTPGIAASRCTMSVMRVIRGDACSLLLAALQIFARASVSIIFDCCCYIRFDNGADTMPVLTAHVPKIMNRSTQKLIMMLLSQLLSRNITVANMNHLYRRSMNKTLFLLIFFLTFLSLLIYLRHKLNK